MLSLKFAQYLILLQNPFYIIIFADVSEDENVYFFCIQHCTPSFVRGFLISQIVGLACIPIVETRFLELAMSLLDFSPRIPLGTFSILLRNSNTRNLLATLYIRERPDLYRISFSKCIYTVHIRGVLYSRRDYSRE